MGNCILPNDEEYLKAKPALDRPQKIKNQTKKKEHTGPKFKYHYTKSFLENQIQVKQNRDYLKLEKDDPLRIAKQNELDQIDMYRMEVEKLELFNRSWKQKSMNSKKKVKPPPQIEFDPNYGWGEIESQELTMQLFYKLGNLSNVEPDE